MQLFQNLSVLENIQVGCHLHTKGGVLVGPDADRAARGRPNATSRRAPANCSTSSAWRALPTTEASALAYGQQRLLEIARALAAKPKLLLLDEPAAGLSADESKRLSAAIRAIAGRGTTVLLIEHDMKLVMNTADTIAVLDFGRKIAEGAPARFAKILP